MMYNDNQWISSFAETVGQQGGLSAAFCAKAEQLASVDGGLLLEEVVTAQDGTRKLVFKLTEGAAAGACCRVCVCARVSQSGDDGAMCARYVWGKTGGRGAVASVWVAAVSTALP